MSYVFIANSWFGRLALKLDWDFGYEELMDLGHVAQNIWKTARKSREDQDQ